MHNKKNQKLTTNLVAQRPADMSPTKKLNLNLVLPILQKEEGKTYTVKEISVASSSTGVTLEETGELVYELGWFDKL